MDFLTQPRLEKLFRKNHLLTIGPYQAKITCLNLTMEPLEQGVKCVQH